MTRILTTAFENALDENILRPIILIHGEFDSGDLRFWTGYGEITYNGDVYQGSGDLLKMNRVDETQNLTANNVTFELSGIPSSLVSLALNENYQCRPITCYFAVLDTSFNLIADPYQIFKGFMDTMVIEDTGDTATISITCENELLRLKESVERRYTPEDQKQDYPDDLGLDFVPIIQDIELNFGTGRTD